VTSARKPEMIQIIKLMLIFSQTGVNKTKLSSVNDILKKFKKLQFYTIHHNKQDTRRGRSRGGSFIPGMGKNFGERVPWYSHFLETHTVKQHHMCNIPHIGY